MSGAQTRRNWIIGGLAAVTIAVATILLVGGGGSGSDLASVQTVAAGTGSETAAAASPAHAPEVGCEHGESGCRPDRKPDDESASDAGPSGGRGDATGESQASAATTEPDAGTPAPEDVPAEPPTGAEEEEAGDGVSKPNRNPDHYGPGGEPPQESTVYAGEPDWTDPPNVNPDHYGPGGEPPQESTVYAGEPDMDGPPERQPRSLGVHSRTHAGDGPPCKGQCQGRPLMRSRAGAWEGCARRSWGASPFLGPPSHSE